MASSRSVYLGAGAVLLVFGAALRLYQWPEQVLLDDEWHAVHQLLTGKTPGELFLSIGHADYSIPLGMLYWLQAEWFGLNEWAMRWPMLLAGLATLFLLPAYAWQRYAPRVAVMFAALLAVSPLLLIYSATARPYALTLLLSLLGIYGFYRFLNAPDQPIAWALVYVGCCALGTWLHAIVGPLLFAPLLLETVRGLAGRRGVALRAIVYLGAPAAVLTAALMLPPMLAEPAGLALKAGASDIGWATLNGVFYAWLGTPSTVCVLALLALAGAGLPVMLRADRLAQSVLLGLALTVLAILLLRPASVHHPLTFGRYLLAAVPLLLLAAAVGAERLLRKGAWRKGLAAAGLAVFAALYLAQSPLPRLLATPNSQLTHSRLQFDFRPEHNRVARYQDATLPLSPFWARLAGAAPGSLNIAAAPFYFETYHWDAPRWERASRQRVKPAFLTGFCAARRYGEVPDSGRFPFRNAYWLSRLAQDAGPRPDWLVYTQPIARFAGTKEGEQMQAEARRCIGQLIAALGEPDYQDEYLLAWRF